MGKAFVGLCVLVVLYVFITLVLLPLLPLFLAATVVGLIGRNRYLARKNRRLNSTHFPKLQ